MARPSKLTDEVVDKMCEAIRAGSFPESAAGFAGISVRTFWRWYERGKSVRCGVYKRFVAAVDKAERDGEVALAAMVRKGAPKDWRAAAFLLERRYRERWAKREELSVHGEIIHGGGVKIVPAMTVFLPEEEPDPTRPLRPAPTRSAGGLLPVAPPKVPSDVGGSHPTGR